MSEYSEDERLPTGWRVKALYLLKHTYDRWECELLGHKDVVRMTGTGRGREDAFVSALRRAEKYDLDLAGQPEKAADNRDERQYQVGKWVERSFSPEVQASVSERVERLYEEVCELAQAEEARGGLVHDLADRFVKSQLFLVKTGGSTSLTQVAVFINDMGQALKDDRLSTICHQVYQKSPGFSTQEVGGISTTLLAYCEARGISADSCERDELNRILALPPDHFKARQAAKVASGMAVEMPPAAGKIGHNHEMLRVRRHIFPGGKIGDVWEYQLEGSQATWGLYGSAKLAVKAAESHYPGVAVRVDLADGGEDWREDPSADERWSVGCDYTMVQLCGVLGVDCNLVSWDAATETLDGDIQSVISRILEKWGGEDWRSQGDVHKILSMSDEEVRSQIIAEGKDPEVEIHRLRDEMNATLEMHKRMTTAEARVVELEAAARKVSLTRYKAEVWEPDSHRTLVGPWPWNWRLVRGKSRGSTYPMLSPQGLHDLCRYADSHGFEVRVTRYEEPSDG